MWKKSFVFGRNFDTESEVNQNSCPKRSSTESLLGLI